MKRFPVLVPPRPRKETSTTVLLLVAMLVGVILGYSIGVGLR